MHRNTYIQLRGGIIMKKAMSIILAGAMVLSLAACGGSSSSETTAADTATTAAQAEASEEASSSSITGAGVATEGTLVMATNAEFPPYEYHDSSTTGPDGTDIVGIDAEIMGAIAEKMGCKLVIEDIAFDSIIPEVTSGKADVGAAGMTVTEDRKQSVDFSDTYASASQVVIVKADSGIKSIVDLEGKTVGVQLGTTGDIYASDDEAIAKVEEYAKGMEAVQALSQGKIDAVVIDSAPAEVFVSETEGLTILDDTYADEDYAIAINKGNTELLNNVNAALAELKAEGKLDEIVAKYITAE